MLKKDQGGVMPPKSSSMPQSTAVGGGSRPITSKVAIETTAPANPHTLGRAPNGWLK